MDEFDFSFAQKFREKCEQRAVGREDVTNPAARVLKNPTSIAFGGQDLRTIFIGSLGADTIVTFRSAVAGLPVAHHAELLAYI